MSILGYVHKTLSSDLFDLTSEPPTLRPSVKAEIIKGLLKGLIDKGIDPKENLFETAHLVGSSITYQHEADADLDIHLHPNRNILKEGTEEWERLKEVVNRISTPHNPIMLPGTELRLEYYLQEDPEQDPKGDAVYQLETDKWLKLPPKLPITMDPLETWPELWEIARREMEEIGLDLGELRRDLTDYSILQKFLKTIPPDQKALMVPKLEKKIQEINDGLDSLADQFTEIHDMRKAEFKKPAITTQVALDSVIFSWNSSNVSKGNILFKILARYEFVTVLANLRAIQRDEELSDQGKAEKAKSFLSGFNLMMKRIPSKNA